MSTTTHPITRQTRAILLRLDDANASLSAAALCRRKPFVGLYSAEELTADVLAPLLKVGLISMRELRRWSETSSRRRQVRAAENQYKRRARMLRDRLVARNGRGHRG